MNSVVLNRGCVKKFPGVREPLHAPTTWEVFEWDCVPSKRHTSANFMPLHVISLTPQRW